LFLFISYFEISGKDFNDEHPQNNIDIEIALLKSQLEISGNEINEEHLQNNPSI